MDDRPWRRVAVVGPPAAGKSLLSTVLRDRLGLPHVELDRLRYVKREPVDDATFAATLATATPPDGRWVVEGAETSRWVTDAWRRAELVIWLDHRRTAIAARMLADCWWALWSGAPTGRIRYCRYQLRKLRRSLGHVAAQRRSLPGRLAEIGGAGTSVVRLSSRRATRRWLDECIPGGGRGALL